MSAGTRSSGRLAKLSATVVRKAAVATASTVASVASEKLARLIELNRSAGNST
jgi:hypothetical protein